MFFFRLGKKKENKQKTLTKTKANLDYIIIKLTLLLKANTSIFEKEQFAE